jgi:hypothetical protein
MGNCVCVCVSVEGRKDFEVGKNGNDDFGLYDRSLQSCSYTGPIPSTLSNLIKLTFL